MDNTQTIPEKEAFSLKKLAVLYDRYLYKWIPFVILILMFAFFGVATKGTILSSMNIMSIINQTIITAIVATGATFIYAGGAFDVSLGYDCAVAAILAAEVYQAIGTENLFLLAIMSIVFAAIIMAFSSVLSAVCRLPVFIVTIAMMSALGALQTQLVGGANLKVNSDVMKAFDASPVKYIIFIVYLAVCYLIFHRTKIGRSIKLMGGNSIFAEQTGISPKKYTIIAFLLASVGIGLGAFLTTTRSGTLSANSCSSLGMDVMIAIVLGGMPISGGAKSHIFAGTLGALMVVTLNMGLMILRVDNDFIQAIRGIVFLVMVLLATKRGRLLPR